MSGNFLKPVTDFANGIWDKWSNQIQSPSSKTEILTKVVIAAAVAGIITGLIVGPLTGIVVAAVVGIGVFAYSVNKHGLGDEISGMFNDVKNWLNRKA